MQVWRLENAFSRLVQEYHADGYIVRLVESVDDTLTLVGYRRKDARVVQKIAAARRLA